MSASLRVIDWQIANKGGGTQASNEQQPPSLRPRSFEAIAALAKWRGATAGFVTAEVFMALREIAT